MCVCVQCLLQLKSVLRQTRNGGGGGAGERSAAAEETRAAAVRAAGILAAVRR